MKKLISLATLLIALVFTVSAQTDIYYSAFFDGASSVVSLSNAHTGLLNNSVSRTFEIWAKRSNNSGTQVVMFQEGMTRDLLNISVTNDTISCVYGTAKVKSIYPTDTTWHHIAFTCIVSAVDTSSVYIDGTLSATNTNAHTNVSYHNAWSYIGVQTPSAWAPSNYWSGNLSKCVWADSILYNATFVPDCVFDTTLYVGTSDSIYAPYICVIPLTNNNNVYTQNFPSEPAFIYTTTLGTSPCAPIYSFRAPVASVIGDTLFAIQTNKSYKKGSHASAHINGWNSVATSLTYGAFIDTIITTHTGSYPYVNDYHVTVDTTIYVNNVSVIDVSTQTHITIYPNPSSTNAITISTTEPLTISICDITGRIVYNNHVTNDTRISLVSGTYIVNAIHSNGTTQAYKVIIQ